jgi:hypothetical protein
MRGKRDWLVIILWIVTASAIGLLLFVLLFIYPKFVALYEELGVSEFPAPTLVVMRLSYVLTSGWWVGVLGLLAVWGGLAMLRRTPMGQKLWARAVGDGRRFGIGVAVGAFVIGLLAMPLVVVSLFLPMIAIQAQLAAGP